MEDFYKILGITKNASKEEIKKSYRKLSMKHHPDRGGNKEMFQKINEAYQILGDERKKMSYDMQRENPLGGIFGQQDMGNMDGLFKMFFGGQMPQMGEPPMVQIFKNGVPLNPNMNPNMNPNVNRKPPAIIKTIEISLKQAYSGVNYPLEIERWVKEENTRRVEREKIYINIPVGIDDGEIIILKNKGNISTNNVCGDIKLYIKVINKTEFTRDGLDLLINKKISLKDALLGFSFELEHISGKSYKINNTNGTIIKPYYKKTIQGLGMIRENSNDKSKNIKGSLVIVFDVEFPRMLSQEQKDMLNKVL